MKLTEEAAVEMVKEARSRWGLRSSTGVSFMGVFCRGGDFCVFGVVTDRQE